MTGSGTGSEITYRNQDLIEFMMNEIKDTLLNYSFIGSDYHLYDSSFGNQPNIQKRQDGDIKLYYTVLPVTYYWTQEYGN